MYHFGIGVKKNLHRTLYWYKKAALKNHAAAQHNLAVMYCMGKGVKKNIKLCTYWAKKAASNGNDISGIEKRFHLLINR